MDVELQNLNQTDEPKAPNKKRSKWKKRRHSYCACETDIDDVITVLDGTGAGVATGAGKNSKKWRILGEWLVDIFSKSLSRRRKKQEVRREQCRKRYSFCETQRRIKANDREFNSAFKYATNYIKTSKYTILTFLPLNLFEQFRRLANFYFLCLLLLQLVPAISSLTPITTAIPLIGVLSLTAVKDAYDDYQRHQNDSTVNNRKSQTIRNGRLIVEKWSNIHVGDILRLDNNQFVAADILLLSTSEPNGLCYIETAELDGETNLKCRQCLIETTELGDNDAKLSAFEGEIMCEMPNNILNKYDGTLLWRGKRFPLDNDNVLLRGCVLRNTQWCYGVVVFTGKDTKLMQNSGKTKFKRTTIDRLLNFLIVGIIFLLLSLSILCMIGCGIWEWYIGRHFLMWLPWDSLVPSDEKTGVFVTAFLVFFSYAIVLNTVVPISLYVSVEVLRFMQSYLINYDEKMRYLKTNTPARARTTTLNEELGQVEYIFSDKTGTLTQNIMTFNKCTINGISYGDVIDKRTGDVIEITESTESLDFSFNPNYEPEFKFYDRSLLDAVERQDPEVFNFFRLLALCHTVMAEQSSGQLEYQAQSPDEAALVSAARNFGFVFKERTPNSITIAVNGQVEYYELLCILDFNNTRKRMSVIVRRNNEIRLYCKGADNVIYDRLKKDSVEVKRKTSEHMNKFAGEGLRTLCLAYRDLDIEFFHDWRIRHLDASSTLDRREEKLNVLYEEIETDMTLIGATAIEDKLQDGVPQTIANLSLAGIKMWVLTGDKQETAINIGYSCELLTDDLIDVYVIDGSTYEEVEHQLNKFRENIKIVNKFQPIKLNTTNHKKKSRVMDEPRDDNMQVPSNGFATNEIAKNGTNSSMRHKDGSGTREKSNEPPMKSPPAVSVVTFKWEGEGDRNYTQSDRRYSRRLTVNRLDRTQFDFEGSLSDNELRYPNGELHQGFALVVNGHSLVHCLHPQLEKLFLDLSSLCKSVICCRVTPLQKALVVDLVKKNKKAVTLAIGDGANDVSMIKTAHIGVGISGQEGMQAVLASDYSIAQFRFLERLLLVHGRWSYFRTCKFLRYFFYKNFAFTLCHIWFAFFCGFSAQTVFDPMFISVYNLFYTALPVLTVGVLDQDVNDRNSLLYPQLYKPGHMNLFFNKREFIRSAMHGFFTATVIFFIPFGAYFNGVSTDGHTLSDTMLFGNVVAAILVIVNTVQMALDTCYWTVFNHLVLWPSVALFFIFDYFYNHIIGGAYIGSLTTAVQDPTFWFATTISTVIVTVPVVAYRFYHVDVHPTLSDRVRLKQRYNRLQSRHSKELLCAPSQRRTRRSLRSGYAFAHQEGFGRLITSGKIMRKLPNEISGLSSMFSSKKNSEASSSGISTQKASSASAMQTAPTISSAVLQIHSKSARAPLQDLNAGRL